MAHSRSSPSDIQAHSVELGVDSSGAAAFLARDRKIPGQIVTIMDELDTILDELERSAVAAPPDPRRRPSMSFAGKYARLRLAQTAVHVLLGLNPLHLVHINRLGG